MQVRFCLQALNFLNDIFLSDRLIVGQWALNPLMKVQFLLTQTIIYMKKVQKRRKGIKAKFSVRGAKHLIVKMKSKLRLKNAAKIAIYKLATAPRTKNRLKRRV